MGAAAVAIKTHVCYVGQRVWCVQHRCWNWEKEKLALRQRRMEGGRPPRCRGRWSPFVVWGTQHPTLIYGDIGVIGEHVPIALSEDARGSKADSRPFDTITSETVQPDVGGAVIPIPADHAHTSFPVDQYRVSGTPNSSVGKC